MILLRNQGTSMVGIDHSLCNNQMSHPGSTYPASSSIFNQTPPSSASPQHRNAVSIALFRSLRTMILILLTNKQLFNHIAHIKVKCYLHMFLLGSLSVIL